VNGFKGLMLQAVARLFIKFKLITSNSQPVKTPYFSGCYYAKNFVYLSKAPKPPSSKKTKKTFQKKAPKLMFL